MLKFIVILITGIGGFCDLFNGALYGFGDQYIEGSYHLIRGAIMAKICIEAIKDENEKPGKTD